MLWPISFLMGEPKKPLYGWKCIWTKLHVAKIVWDCAYGSDCICCSLAAPLILGVCGFHLLLVATVVLALLSSHNESCRFYMRFIESLSHDYTIQAWDCYMRFFMHEKQWSYTGHCSSCCRSTYLKKQICVLLPCHNESCLNLFSFWYI